MAKRAAATPKPASPARATLTSIRVQGYKSIVDASLTIRPLTVLAGANSSGKSSMMQPLLLMKQTTEVPYSTNGALVLSGEHLRATSAGQLVSALTGQEGFSVTFTTQCDGENSSVCVEYQVKDQGLFLVRQIFRNPMLGVKLAPGMDGEEIKDQILGKELGFAKEFIKEQRFEYKMGADFRVGTPFLAALYYRSQASEWTIATHYDAEMSYILRHAIHLPGLRGAPQRTYATAFLTTEAVIGTFEPYTAGIIQRWQNVKNERALDAISFDLSQLGLTQSVAAATVNANEIEVKVGRLPVSSKAKKDEMVNIADVGFGVSQVLPIVVALIAAEPGQLVYIEQPELHLHPRAQVEMAKLLAQAAKRGVRVVVETHSSLLLLTIQTLVAEKELSPEEVALHWFSRDAKGATTVKLADLDEKGTYGDWPEDFGDVELAAQSAYLDAITRQNPRTNAK